MDELISVIILTYNQEKYIQDTIRSVIDQDYPNLELLILDDCSTDNTVKRIYEMNEHKIPITKTIIIIEISFFRFNPNEMILSLIFFIDVVLLNR